MIKGRKLDHIGVGVTDVEASCAWYRDILGFTVIGDFVTGGVQAYFLKSGDTVYEMYQEDLPTEIQGKIDHIAYVSEDIEADYAFCKEQGYTITTDGIEAIPEFWDNGCRYFKIASPTGEQVEFCQVL